MQADLVPLERRPLLLAEATKFGLVGIGNTLLSLGAYSALLAAGSPYLIAASVSAGTFLANRRWRSSPSTRQ